MDELQQKTMARVHEALGAQQVQLIAMSVELEALRTEISRLKQEFSEKASQ